MTCAEFEVILSDYVDGNVTVEQRRAVESHADVCVGCRELLRDVFQAVSFIESVEDVAPPPELITRIALQAPRGRIREGGRSRGPLGRAFFNWLQPVLQPRFAMSLGMTILSFAMVGRCTGIRPQEIKSADLNPIVLWNNLEDKTFRTWDRTVKYYENLRLVYEVETRLNELRDQQEASQGVRTPATTGAGSKPAKPANPEENTGGTRK
jgi:hypothetical protein